MKARDLDAQQAVIASGTKGHVAIQSRDVALDCFVAFGFSQ